MNQIKEYTDETLLSFGKHKNKPLGKVPAEWLMWARDNIPTLDPKLKAYINANMQGLQQEVARHKRK